MEQAPLWGGSSDFFETPARIKGAVESLVRDVGPDQALQRLEALMGDPEVMSHPTFGPEIESIYTGLGGRARSSFSAPLPPAGPPYVGDLTSEPQLLMDPGYGGPSAPPLEAAGAIPPPAAVAEPDVALAELLGPGPAQEDMFGADLARAPAAPPLTPPVSDPLAADVEGPPLPASVPPPELAFLEPAPPETGSGFTPLGAGGALYEEPLAPGFDPAYEAPLPPVAGAGDPALSFFDALARPTPSAGASLPPAGAPLPPELDASGRFSPVVEAGAGLPVDITPGATMTPVEPPPPGPIVVEPPPPVYDRGAFIPSNTIEGDVRDRLLGYPVGHGDAVAAEAYGARGRAALADMGAVGRDPVGTRAAGMARGVAPPWVDPDRAAGAPAGPAPARPGATPGVSGPGVPAARPALQPYGDRDQAGLKGALQGFADVLSAGGSADFSSAIRSVQNARTKALKQHDTAAARYYEAQLKAMREERTHRLNLAKHQLEVDKFNRGDKKYGSPQKLVGPDGEDRYYAINENDANDRVDLGPVPADVVDEKLPADVQTAQWYIGASPEARAAFDKVKGNARDTQAVKDVALALYEEASGNVEFDEDGVPVKSAAELMEESFREARRIYRAQGTPALSGGEALRAMQQDPRAQAIKGQLDRGAITAAEAKRQLKELGYGS